MRIKDTYVVRREGMFCIEMALASIASWRGRQYELMFENTWQFDFVPQDNGLIGTGIVPGEWDLAGAFEKYHGIKSSIANINGNQDILEVIKHQLKNNLPVLMGLNYSSATWLPDFDNATHTFLLIVGLSDDEQTVFVHDLHLSYIVKEMQHLPVSNLFEGHTSDFIFSVISDEKKDVNYPQLLTGVVNKVMDKSNGSNMFEKIRMFAEHFSDSLDFSLEIEDDVIPLETPLINNIETLERGRALFSYFLKYVGESAGNNKIIDISDRFANSKWKTLKTLVLKSYYRKALSKDKHSELVRLIENIAAAEEKAANDLLTALIEPSVLPHISTRQVTKPQQMNRVDISNFYNNNAFTTSMANDFCADFTGADQCFLVHGVDEINNVLATKDMPVPFPAIIEGKNNNISCDQQEIPVPKGCYSSLYLIASSEFGDVVDSITIVYDDEQVLDLKVTISDWWREIPSYGEEIVWSGKVLMGKAPAAHIVPDKECNIYAKGFPLPKEGCIKKIILPLRPNLHIFSISMGTVSE